MKRFTSLILIIIITFTFIACGTNKTINGKKYETYGLINQEEVKDPAIKYNLIVGNIVWSVILCETVIVPLYFFGWSLWEPIKAK
jgi:hypothetical protein